MPVNVTHEYVQAEKEYHEAQTTREKIAALKNMLSKAPTHKGAEKLRAELKTKLAKLRQDLEKEKRIGKGKSLTIKKEGAAQVVLIGPPNAGKSHVLGVLSESEVEEEKECEQSTLRLQGYRGLKQSLLFQDQNYSNKNETCLDYGEWICLNTT